MEHPFTHPDFFYVCLVQLMVLSDQPVVVVVRDLHPLAITAQVRVAILTLRDLVADMPSIEVIHGWPRSTPAIP